MADRRRRRPSEGESEEESGDLQRKERPSECESEGEHVEGEQELSEYESANEEHGEGKNEDDEGEEEEEEDEEGSEEEEETDDEEDEEEEEDDDETETYDGDSIVIDEYEGMEEERQSGDGEEQPSQDVDDDEDRKNPAFVPRRGAFYEHDMRIHEEGEEGDDKRPKKKLWKDDGKWIHDRYREDQQGPKSREELVAIYGYDILQYDKPPDAPQRGGNSRPRGRRSDQRSTLRDFVQDRQNRPPSRRSPQSDFVERKNSYNNENERRRNYYDKEQNYNSQNDYTANRSSSLEPDDQRYNTNQERSYSRTPDRNFQANRGSNRFDTDRNYNRGQDQRNYNTPDRNYDNRQRNNYSTRGRGNRGGGRFEGRGSRRGRGGDDRTKRNYSDLRDKNNRGRKYPPRFQHKQDYERRYDNSEYYDDYDDYDMPTTVVIDTSIPEPVTPPASPPPEQKPAPQQNYQKTSIPTNVSSDNSQNSGPSGPGERKSYAKDRRGRTSGRIPDIDVDSQDLAAAEQGLKHLSIQGSPQSQDQEPQAASPKSRSSPSPKQSYDSNQQRSYKSRGNAKQQDLSQQGRPKRYSSQRQRNTPDVPYTENVPPQSQVFNKQASVPQENQAFYKRTYIEPEGPTTPTFRPALIQPGAMAFPIPVSSGAMPSQPPPVFRPPHSNVAPVTLSTQVPIMPPPQYINTGMIYPAPPPPFPVQATPIPIPAYPTPQSVNTQQQPQQQNQQNPRQDFYRGGTTYYAPELQYKKPHTSPVRRLKSAIPIVDPQEVKRGKASPEDMSQMSQSNRLRSNLDAGVTSDSSPSVSPDVQVDNIKSEPLDIPSQEVLETDQRIDIPEDKKNVECVNSGGDCVSVDKNVLSDYDAGQSELRPVSDSAVKTEYVENLAISSSAQPSGDMEDKKVSQNVIETTT